MCVLVAPAMDVRASMARDVQGKHVHNRHQQLGSHRIMLSVGAEKALPTLGHADCTMHPVVLDDPLDRISARTSAEPSSALTPLTK